MMMEQKKPKILIEGVHYEIAPNGCWEWLRGKDRHGYGRMFIPGTKTTIGAHRMSYEENKGPLDKALYVCHTCDNTSCVNPEHLFLGSQKDNMKDMIEKKGHYSAQLTWGQVQDIREATGKTHQAIADEYKVARTTITNIKNGKRRTYA